MRAGGSRWRGGGRDTAEGREAVGRGLAVQVKAQGALLCKARQLAVLSLCHGDLMQKTDYQLVHPVPASTATPCSPAAQPPRSSLWAPDVPKPNSSPACISGLGPPGVGRHCPRSPWGLCHPGNPSPASPFPGPVRAVLTPYPTPSLPRAIARPGHSPLALPKWLCPGVQALSLCSA